MSAQPVNWTERVRAAVNVGVQGGAGGLSESSTPIRNAEPSPLSAELASATVPWVEGGVMIRLHRNTGVGLSISALSHTGDADVRADVPHPFFFDRPRTVTGFTSVQHREVAAHISGVYMASSRPVEIALLGGLSAFSIDQDVVVDVTYAQAYPYDTATFTGAELSRETKSTIGYHVGADITWRLAPRWGLGGLVRYSRATVPTDGMTIEAGGLQAGGGLRVMF